MATVSIPETDKSRASVATNDIYAPNILIVGDSGSGKSTSYEGLPQDGRTGVIETELKALPFPHKFQKIEYVDDVNKFYKALEKFKKDPEIKFIVIDSISKHLERCLAYCRGSFKNYDIWSNYGSMGHMLMNAVHCKDKIIIAISLAELVELESNETGTVATNYKRMAATFMGKELQGKLDKEFTIVCHTHVLRDKTSGMVSFNFRVKPDGLSTAKTPKVMFSDTKTGLAPNDILLVLKEIGKLDPENYQEFANPS
jgi:hypothetical protein